MSKAAAPTGNHKVTSPSRPSTSDPNIAHTGSNAYRIAARTGVTCFWKIFSTSNATKLPNTAHNINGKVKSNSFSKVRNSLVNSLEATKYTAIDNVATVINMVAVT